MYCETSIECGWLVHTQEYSRTGLVDIRIGFKLAHTRKEPFIIGRFYGKNKPSNVAEFLQPFVDEYLSYS